MPVTINANMLTISHKGSGGFEMCSAPDVCKTPAPPGPPVPIPYMITSFSKDLIRGSMTVKADGGNSIDIRGSAHMPCIGDEPGTVGGVISNTFKHESTWITYSPNVYVEGKNICRLTDKMFMNNRNTVSGVGGHFEVPLGMTDPVMIELCQIFCEAREEWHKCKRSGRNNCPRPSKIAEGKVKNSSKLADAVKKKFPRSKVTAEKTYFSAVDDMFDGARKVYDKSALKRAVQRQIKKAMQKKIVAKGAKMAARAWTKFIPGLNVISTVYDVVDTAITAKELYDMVARADEIADKAIKVKPDVGIEGPEGTLDKVYDFKFDDPDTGYQDDWQRKQMQEEAYTKATGGKKPTKVDVATCKCDPKPGKPATNMM